MSVLPWFGGYGIELEYMIVDARTLAVKPITDQVLRVLEQQALAHDAQPTAAELASQATDDPPMEVALGPIAWSNELALHVIEIKTNGPVASLAGVADAFHHAVLELNQTLQRWGARLLPTAMHPLMRPEHEFRLWPRDEEGIYATFDRIFDCRGHGWSNLQSMHLNLPFSSDAEFAALHAATRFVLPLLPALAASSPLLEGQWATHLDERMHTYRGNARRVPSVSGLCIPESAASRAEYEEHILGKIYSDLAPHDPDGALQYEWVNARGAIARFDRMALEIRVLDAQECPRADLALAHLVSEVLRLHTQRGEFLAHDRAWSAQRLSRLLDATVQQAGSASIDDLDYLALCGVPSAEPLTAQEFWRALALQVPAERRLAELWPDVEFFLHHGSLAGRIRQRLGVTAMDTPVAPTVSQIAEVYAELCECLANNQRFLA